MSNAANWSRIPAELRALDQWVIAGQDKTPLSLDSNNKLYGASVTDRSTWLPFDDAAAYAYTHGLAVGFVLSPHDAFACIDFDVCDAQTQAAKGEPIDPTQWTDPAWFEWFWQLVQEWDSYTEISHSGKGLHVWVMGSVPKGIKKKPIEIYSDSRYMICTGNVIHDADIKNRSNWLEHFALQLDGDRPVVALEEVPETLTDHTVYQRLLEAGNAEKAVPLWNGKWKEMGYPSQSEGDLALMSMLAFYSESNEQCRRLFRMSALGQRAKATKNNRYLDYTLRVIRSRQKAERKADFNAVLLRAEEMARIGNEKRTGLHVPQAAQGVPMQAPAPVAAAMLAPVAAEVQLAQGSLPWPPGLAGRIAGFIYQSAPRPVTEVAIVAALGLLAGVCGKAWYIPGSGLNLYIILIARSAIGKEAMHSGISALLNGVSPRCPEVTQFVNFSDFASGPALIKFVALNDSTVQVSGEFGKKLRRMANDIDGRDAAMNSLRTAMIDLYQKSGPQSIVGGITYSNQDNNIASISGVAYSMIGETTPKTFYECLTEEMMEDGFLSRFTMIAYDGERPPLNVHALKEPDKTLTEAFGSLAKTASGYLAQGKKVGVAVTQEGSVMFQAFEKECDAQINSTTDERWRQMWNRASLKVMRISALLAVADNWLHPVIETHHIDWALLVVRRDIQIMIDRLKSGDVGNTDDTREQKVKHLIYDVLVNGASEGYKVPQAMIQAGVVTHQYLSIRTSRLAAFSKHRLGSTNSLNQTLKSLVDSGYIEEIGKESLKNDFGYAGKAYRITKSLQSFKEM